MSVKKSKLDLLVRVRYSNSLPAPPCPPKLLHIPTNPSRYARPEFLDAIADDAPLPMVIDAECGMPIDLAKWDCLWDEDGDDSTLNPNPDNVPPLDPKDAFLLEDISASISLPYGNVPTTSGPSSSPAPAAHVSWLRKTEYISRDISTKTVGTESKYAFMAAVDVSRDAQLRDIEASFTANSDEFDLSTLKHPNNPNLTAVECYDVLPDEDIWSNQYDLFRFSERPGERPVDQEDPRLDCAILRPMKSDHDSFLAYYLAEDDAAAEKLKAIRASLPPYDVPANQEETTFNFVRDYETVKVEQDVPNEFLLVLDDGQGDRPKGAYYKDIERKMILKKKRQASYEEYEDKWEVIRFTYADMDQEEIEERDDALAEVKDPNYVTAMMMRDAEGEDDDTFLVPGELAPNNVHGANLESTQHSVEDT